MSLRCGIVGLPNVGKSTLFNALTNSKAAAQNYPFCTIEASSGIVPVPDPRLDQLAQWVQPERILPAQVEFVDIAGLVAGASQGEGLGNQFLANIRETTAIIQVVRCFEDPDIIHVQGKVSPLDDLEIIHTELALADLLTVEKSRSRQEKLARSGDRTAQKQVALLTQIHQHLDQNQPLRTLPLSDAEHDCIKPLCLLTAKPMLCVANIDPTNPQGNAHFQTLSAYAQQHQLPVIPICATFEAELAELEADERLLFLQEMQIEEPGLYALIRSGYQLLNLHTYFTAGKQEVHAWPVAVGATAPQAAGVIHSDFERGFIRAEVISFTDYQACKSAANAKEQGKLRVEGKTYVVQDGDVIHFRFNV